MKLNISAVDLLSLRMTQAVAIALDRISAFAGVPWRLVRANQPGSSPCRASVAGSSAWISVQPLSVPSALTAEKEIGRGAWRERVGQSVWIQVVAGALKK